MSRRNSKVEANSGYIDAEYSSGDCNKMVSKKNYQEENNNQVDELSKELQMGCIVDAVKRPPNICIENYVYEESDSEEISKIEEENEADGYSDEFEEDKSGDEREEETVVETKSETNERNSNASNVKLSKSHSYITNGTSKPSSVSGRSSGYGSISVPQTRRINMSFTNDRLREIERHNHILLTKIMSARNVRKSSIPPREQPARKPMPAAAFQRKAQQRQIDHDNMILLNKIQRAKSSACSLRR